MRYHGKVFSRTHRFLLWDGDILEKRKIKKAYKPKDIISQCPKIFHYHLWLAHSRATIGT